MMRHAAGATPRGRTLSTRARAWARPYAAIAINATIPACNPQAIA